MSANSKKKPRCILHIGMHKTGSSSIQNTLHNQDENDEFEYLDLGSANHSGFMYSLFSSQPERYHGNIKRGLTKEEVSVINRESTKKLTTALEKSSADLIIISGEDISFLTHDELCNLRDFLNKFVSSILVVGYVRPPAAYIQSAFQQNVKEGFPVFDPDYHYPNYRYKFEKFDIVFGLSNVALYKYDNSLFPKNDVVWDFANKVNIHFNSKSIERVNESISLEAVSLLYIYHKFGFGFGNYASAGIENQQLVHQISKIGYRKVKLASSFLLLSINRHVDDIMWMESRLGASLTESLSDSDEGISSEDDLIAIALECADDLTDIIAEKIRPQLVTPQKIAGWIHLLRHQLSINPAFSKAQIARLEAEAFQPGDMLQELVLSLGRAGHNKASSNVQIKLAEFLHNDVEKKPINCDYTPDLSYSIDLFLNGYIMGWIVDKNRPLHKLSFEISQAQRVIATGVADKFRQDLADAGIGDGCCAFRIRTEIDPAIEGGAVVLRVIDFIKEFQVQLT